MIPATLEYSRNKVKGYLTKFFKKQDVFLSVILQLSIADKIGNMREWCFDIININFLSSSLTEQGDRCDYPMNQDYLAEVLYMIKMKY